MLLPLVLSLACLNLVPQHESLDREADHASRLGIEDLSLSFGKSDEQRFVLVIVEIAGGKTLHSVSPFAKQGQDRVVSLGASQGERIEIGFGHCSVLPCWPVGHRQRSGWCRELSTR